MNHANSNEVLGEFRLPIANLLLLYDMELTEKQLQKLIQFSRECVSTANMTEWLMANSGMTRREAEAYVDYAMEVDLEMIHREFVDHWTR